MSKITFLASENKDFKEVLHYSEDITQNLRDGVDDVVVSDLSFLSFELFYDGFTEIELYYKGQFYQLKLGSNTWTEKELRVEHNLLKLVKASILWAN